MVRLTPARTPLPSVERLRECLTYNPVDGSLFWRERADRAANWNAAWAGMPAGTVRNDGYLCVQVDGKQLAAHRVIWKMMTGQEPTIVDHVDGDRLNNRWANIRSASENENHRNSRARGDFAKGVYRNRDGRFVAQIKVADTNTYLGAYTTEGEANAAYAGAAKVLFGDFACATR